MAAPTSFVYSASQCSGVADYLRECTGSQLTILAMGRVNHLHMCTVGC